MQDDFEFIENTDSDDFSSSDEEETISKKDELNLKSQKVIDRPPTPKNVSELDFKLLFKTLMETPEEQEESTFPNYINFKGIKKYSVVLFSALFLIATGVSSLASGNGPKSGGKNSLKKMLVGDKEFLFDAFSSLKKEVGLLGCGGGNKRFVVEKIIGEDVDVFDEGVGLEGGDERIVNETTAPTFIENIITNDECLGLEEKGRFSRRKGRCRLLKRSLYNYHHQHQFSKLASSVSFDNKVRLFPSLPRLSITKTLMKRFDINQMQLTTTTESTCSNPSLMKCNLMIKNNPKRKKSIISSSLSTLLPIETGLSRLEVVGSSVLVSLLDSKKSVLLVVKNENHRRISNNRNHRDDNNNNLDLSERKKFTFFEQLPQIKNRTTTTTKRHVRMMMGDRKVQTGDRLIGRFFGGGDNRKADLLFVKNNFGNRKFEKLMKTAKTTMLLDDSKKVLSLFSDEQIENYYTNFSAIDEIMMMIRLSLKNIETWYLVGEGRMNKRLQSLMKVYQRSIERMAEKITGIF